MRVLRGDLQVHLPRESSDGPHVVADPFTGGEFEFGNAEYFLIQSIREPYDEARLVDELNSRFGLSRSVQDFHAFLDILERAGLTKDLPESTAKRGVPRGVIDPTVAMGTDLPAGKRNGSSHGSLPRGSAGPVAFEERQDGWHLFRPEWIFDGLDWFLRPIRHAIWLIPALLVLAIAGVFARADSIGADLLAIRAEFSILARLALAGFTVNLTTQVFRGIVARYHDLRVPSFRLVLAFGLIPSFSVVFEPPQRLAKTARMWIAATPIIVRLGLFALAVFVWLVTRSSGTMLPSTAGMIAIISLLGFLITANPLLNGDGYRLLCTYYEIPNLRERANRALKGVFRPQPEAIVRYTRDMGALRAYALASGAFIVVLLGVIAIIVAKGLESSFQGTGVVLFVLVVAYLLLRYRRRSGKNSEPKPSPSVTASQNAKGSAEPRSEDDRIAMSNAHPSARHGSGNGRFRRVARVVLAVVFLGCLFLPYQYETGGAAEVLPIVRQPIHAETFGVIEKVYFSGGESVAAGSVIAQMSSHRESRDLVATDLRIQAQQSNVSRLETTPSSEQLDLSRAQVATATVQYEHAAAREGRMKRLYESAAISFEDYTTAVEEMEVARQRVSESRANLLAIQTTVNPHEVEAARAEEASLKAESAYFAEQLRRTSLRAPIDGRLVTMQLRDLENTFLELGDLFAEVEDLSAVRVVVSIPESDIGEVKLGDRVRLKLWAYPDRVFVSHVSLIHPTTVDDGSRKVTQIESVMANPEGLFLSGMTGHAKVEGEQMFLIQAFTRALVRFFLIEVWSWLP